MMRILLLILFTSSFRNFQTWRSSFYPRHELGDSETVDFRVNVLESADSRLGHKYIAPKKSLFLREYHPSLEVSSTQNKLSFCQESYFYVSIIFMKVKDIIIQIDTNEHNPLRSRSRAVTKDEFSSIYLRDVITSMKQTLAKESDGVAIAAPQIGVGLRLFVVATSSYEESAKLKPLVFINPKITKQSKKTAIMQEGCLSVRWIYGKTKRAIACTIEAYDEGGKKFTYGGKGLLAHIFQHEADHLDGILFIDHGFDLEEFTEEEVREAEKKSKEK